MKTKEEIKVPAMKLIQVEDIRNREVYLINYGELIQKGKVISFGIDCQIGDNPTIYDIEVEMNPSGRVETFDSVNDLIFSKEEAKAKLNQIVESL
jgi:hypothetical protein